MALLYDETQIAILEEAQKLLKSHYSAEKLLTFLETKAQYDTALWDVAKAQGWTAVAIDEENGGLGLSLTEVGLIAQAQGENCAALPFLTSTWPIISALNKFGNDGQKSDLLPKIAAGELIGAFGFAQKQSPIPQKPSLAIANGQVNGRLDAVLAGAMADIALVLAQSENVPVLALVALDSENVKREIVDTFDNSRLLANLLFENVPADILCSGEDAIKYAKNILAEVAVIAAHEQMGGAKVMMEKARDYSLERKAFGQPIGAFQSVKHRIAELYGLVELARANAIFAASRFGHRDFILAAAAARLTSTEAYDTASRDCVQIHGGIGVTWEGGLHLHQRRARSLANEAGNMIFWEDILVDELQGQ